MMMINIISIIILLSRLNIMMANFLSGKMGPKIPAFQGVKMVSFTLLAYMLILFSCNEYAPSRVLKALLMQSKSLVLSASPHFHPGLLGPGLSPAPTILGKPFKDSALGLCTCHCLSLIFLLPSGPQLRWPFFQEALGVHPDETRCPLSEFTLSSPS